jgi:hypothetical protein
VGTFHAILLAMVNQIVAKGVFNSNQVGLSLTKEPSAHAIANSYLTITPGQETALPGQNYGVGRYGAGMSSVAWVNIYCRLALDFAYQDTQYYISSSGLRPFVFQIHDALQLFLPVDSLGNALTEEPIRAIGNERTVKYQRSDDWGFISIPFSVVYAKQCLVP